MFIHPTGSKTQMHYLSHVGILRSHVLHSITVGLQTSMTEEVLHISCPRLLRQQLVPNLCSRRHANEKTAAELLLERQRSFCFCFCMCPERDTYDPVLTFSHTEPTEENSLTLTFLSISCLLSCLMNCCFASVAEMAWPFPEFSVPTTLMPYWWRTTEPGT